MRGILLAALFCLGSAGSVYAADCNQTSQLTYDGLSQKLAAASEIPQSASLAERYCLTGIVGQITGKVQGDLTALSSSNFALIANVVEKATPDLEPTEALSSSALFKALSRDLDQSCTTEVRNTQADALTPKQASACGVIRLPGTPKGLGKFTAKYESGQLEGGYASISADHGAGGWTYGKYQLASKAGGIEGFLGTLLCKQGSSQCMDAGYRPIGEALIVAGGVKGAQAHTTKFVEAWQHLSLNDRRMQQAQENYQTLVSWRPVQRMFSEDFNIDLSTASCGLREQAFAMRTQHTLSSTNEIFAAAIKVAGTADQPKMIVEANKYRLAKLGQPGGYYAKYEAICDGRQPPEGKATKEYSCSYISGVRNRWTEESRELSALSDRACPL